MTDEVKQVSQNSRLLQKAFPLMEIPLSGEMSEGQKGAVSGEEKGDRLRWMR